ncbi:hypothetical protein K432DRAFT_394264 [Lepidopterella palustris CBS 459.81]|uniref:Uncharacterized protein n=1 Tax=Lepidopterella palustris CBS 459.81 TaxID=1314670 RepID=A0A8E2E8C7_9PEZI|nr:hypothetical protein K432DRAFT_394264 [Lepidopterella palustris CBS 459.81]
MAVCAACQQPLVLEISASDEEDSDVEMGGGCSASAAAPVTTNVPDDVHLNCGCHFHWQCLLDAYTLQTCPSCSSPISTISSETGTEQVLCNLHNEGGFQEQIDILPLLVEEGYLKAYPEERRARAFLEFCREGDVEGVVGILQDNGEDEDEETIQTGDGEGQGRTKLLTYQDPLGDMHSGLHAAVAGGSREVAWLLLLLASQLPLSEFPAVVFEEAGRLGVMREEQALGDEMVDIRRLRDANGRTAEDLAAEMGGVWAGWVGTGRLAVG